MNDGGRTGLQARSKEERRKRNVRGIPFVGFLLLFLFLVSCERSPELLKLDEIPAEQLRVVLKGYAGDWRKDTDLEQGFPEPPSEVSVPEDAVRISLPKQELLGYGDLSVREAIASRRSRRAFSAESITIQELAYLLWMTQGVTDFKEESGEVYRAAPSAGGRFPIETCLAIHRVDGLKPGIYRYRPNRHELVLVREDAGISSAMASACYGQGIVGNAAVVFVWTAVPYRTEWKYAYLSHRMIAMEAGHICQNLYLASESIGAGTCAMLSYDQPTLDSLIGIDGTDEFAVYMACVGKREERKGE